MKRMGPWWCRLIGLAALLIDIAFYCDCHPLSRWRPLVLSTDKALCLRVCWLYSYTQFVHQRRESLCICALVAVAAPETFLSNVHCNLRLYIVAEGIYGLPHVSTLIDIHTLLVYICISPFPTLSLLLLYCDSSTSQGESVCLAFCFTWTAAVNWKFVVFCSVVVFASIANRFPRSLTHFSTIGSFNL